MKCYRTNRVFKSSGSIQLTLHCSRETSRDVIPIGDLNIKIEIIFSLREAYLENSFDVVRSDVLVLEVVGVLPHVDTEQRDKAGSGLQGVLRMRIRSCDIRISISRCDVSPDWHRRLSGVSPSLC